MRTSQDAELVQEFAQGVKVLIKEELWGQIRMWHCGEKGRGRKTSRRFGPEFMRKTRFKGLAI